MPHKFYVMIIRAPCVTTDGVSHAQRSSPPSPADPPNRRRTGVRE